ncbi:hypothetical protein D3C72_1943690 [compost metagenome]
MIHYVDHHPLKTGILKRDAGLVIVLRFPGKLGMMDFLFVIHFSVLSVLSMAKSQTQIFRHFLCKVKAAFLQVHLCINMLQAVG